MSMVRMSAEERRESVVRAAMREFAATGFYGTSTEAIAQRVGVSQPYLFRLFPGGKKAIFLAAAVRCIQETRAVFADATNGLEGEDAVRAVGDAYTAIIIERPDRLLMQMQIYTAMAAAQESGDTEFVDEIRAEWLKLWDTAMDVNSGDIEDTTVFMAFGMLINTLIALGFPADHRVWEGIYPEARTKGFHKR